MRWNPSRRPELLPRRRPGAPPGAPPSSELLAAGPEPHPELLPLHTSSPPARSPARRARPPRRLERIAADPEHLAAAWSPAWNPSRRRPGAPLGSVLSFQVSGPAASAYKGYSWSKEKEEYLSSRGLSNATYITNAAELREDLFGALVPCTFQEITASGSNQPTPNHARIHNDIRFQPGAQSVDLNYDAAGSGHASVEHYSKPKNQGYSVRGQAFNRLETTSSPSSHMFPTTLNKGYAASTHEVRSSSSSHFSPNNLNNSGAVDAQPVSKQYMVCIIHFDGASKGNPGKAGAGAVLMTEDGRVISRLREGLGVVTNNVAEYRGLILGLKYAIRHGFKRIKVNGDSQLVCYQVKGTWQTKHQNMMELCKEVRKLQENFISFEINHVRREWNAEADRQANIAITLASGAVSEERGDGF